MGCKVWGLRLEGEVQGARLRPLNKNSGRGEWGSVRVVSGFVSQARFGLRRVCASGLGAGLRSKFQVFVFLELRTWL